MAQLSAHGARAISVRRRKDLLLSVSVLASITGYMRSAYAQAVCTPGGGSTYICTGTSTQSQEFTAPNTEVVATGNLSIDTTATGGAPISISGDGALVFRDAPGATVNLKAPTYGPPGPYATDTSGLAIRATGTAAGVPASITIDTAGTFRGRRGVYAWATGGGTGSVSVDFDGVAEGTGAYSEGMAVGRIGGTGDLVITTGAGSRITGQKAGINALATTMGTTRISVDGYAAATDGGSINAMARRGNLEITTGATSVLKGQTGIIAQSAGPGRIDVDISGDIKTVAGAYGAFISGRGPSGGISFKTRRGSAIYAASSVVIDNGGRGDTVVDLGGYLLPTGIASTGISVTNDNPFVRTDISLTTQTGSWIYARLLGIFTRNDSPGGVTTIKTNDDVWGLGGGNAISAQASGAAGDIVIETNSAANRSLKGAKYGIDVANMGTGSSDITVNNTVVAVGIDGYDVGTGLHVRNIGASQDIRITVGATGNIVGGRDGINAVNEGSGSSSLTILGKVTSTNLGSGATLINRENATDLTVRTGAGSLVQGPAGMNLRNYGSGSTAITIDGDIEAADAALTVQTFSGNASTIMVGASAKVVSARSTGIVTKGAAEITLAGDIGGYGGTAIQFDVDGDTDDRLILEPTWMMSGYVDAAGGDDTLEFGGNPATVYDAGTMHFGWFDGDFRNFEHIEGATAATGTILVQATRIAYDAQAAGLDMIVRDARVDATGALHGVTLQSGVLYVSDGNLIAPTVTIDDESIFGGAGTIVGDVTSTGGTFSPGFKILGSLTIDGNLTLDDESTFYVRAGKTGQSDRAVVTQAANLAGVVVVETDEDSSYRDARYTILSAPTGLSGAFADAFIANGSAFIIPRLTQTGTEVILETSVASFTSVADTPNQQQVAAALDDLEQTGDALTVYNAFAGLDESWARYALRSVSGEIHVAGGQVVDETFALLTRTLRNRHSGSSGEDVQLTNYAAAPMGSAAIAEALATSSVEGYRTAWLTPLAGRGVVAAGSPEGLNWSNAGLLGGGEIGGSDPAGEFWAGFGLGYAQTWTGTPTLTSTLDAASVVAGLYGGQRSGPWNVSGSLVYGVSGVETERQIFFGGVDRTATAEYLTQTLGLSGEVSFDIPVAPQTTLSPLATFYAGWTGHGGFSETGAGALNLSSTGGSRMKLDAGIGLALEHTITTGTAEVTIGGRAIWEHAFADAGERMTLSGSPTAFVVMPESTARDRLRLGLDIGVNLPSDLTLGARYEGMLSGTQTSQAASVELRQKF